MKVSYDQVLVALCDGWMPDGPVAASTISRGLIAEGLLPAVSTGTTISLQLRDLEELGLIASLAAKPRRLWWPTKEGLATRDRILDAWAVPA